MLKESEIKALVALLDDDDREVVTHVEQKILSTGTGIIPMLEREWEGAFRPVVRHRIEDLIHTLQFERLKERFLHWKDTGSEDLLEGLWIVATYRYPGLEKKELSKQIDRLYRELRGQLHADMTPYESIEVFNRIFFNQFGFSANTKHFHAPTNSMLNSVLASKKGNPITLCAIYMMLAQRMEWPIYGVNLPNLFILIYKQEKGDPFYINVFNRGLIFNRSDIDNYLENLQLAKKDIFYEPCSNLDVVLRSLRNLSVSFEKEEDYHKADEIKIILQTLDNRYFNF